MNIYIASPLRAATNWELMVNMHACFYYKKYTSSLSGKTGRGVHDTIPRIYDNTDPAQRKQAMEIGQAVLRSCDELYCCGKKLSCGMREEVQLALSLKMPVVCFSMEMDHALMAAGLQHLYFKDKVLASEPIEIVCRNIIKKAKVSEEEMQFIQEGRDEMVNYFKKNFGEDISHTL